MKKCAKCKIEKGFAEFYKNKAHAGGLTYQCKDCIKSYEKTPARTKKILALRLKYKSKPVDPVIRERNRLRSLAYGKRPEVVLARKVYYQKHKKRQTEKRKAYYENNKNEQLLRQKIKRGLRTNAEILREKAYKKEWYKKNFETIKKKKHDYQRKNKSKFSKYQKNYYAQPQNKKLRNNYLKEKRKKDPSFSIACNYRSRLWQALTKQKVLKSEGLLKLTGCSIEFLKKHLRLQFTEGMSWSNYGQFGWHVDHIRPCSNFDLTKKRQRLECFNWKNLQPLWWKPNLEKGAKLNYKVDKKYARS